jgi:hypothetical protein
MFHYLHSLMTSTIAAMHVRAEATKTDFSIDSDRSTVRSSAAKFSECAPWS